MTSVRILVPSQNFSTTASLLENEAPKTCEGILGALPIEGLMTHASFSGNETQIEFSKPMVKLDPENWVYNVIPGDIVYSYSMWGDKKYQRGRKEQWEIAFIYGRNAQFTDSSFRSIPVNLFGEFDPKRGGFAELCRNVFSKGPVTVRIEKA